MLIYILLLAHEMQKVELDDTPPAQGCFPLRPGAADLSERKKAVQNLKGPEAALAIIPYRDRPLTKPSASYPA
jgi:hypothetical protein